MSADVIPSALTSQAYAPAAFSMDVVDNRAAFERISRVASALFDGADAGVTLMEPDGHRIWLGSENRCVKGHAGFCAATIQSPDVLWVEDARADPRFADLDVVRDAPLARFYVGAPITVEGRRIGAVWVWGPQTWTREAARENRLMDLAVFLADQIELKLSHDRLARESQARATAEHERDQLFEFPVAIVMLDRDRRITRYSKQWAQDYLPDPDVDVRGKNFHELFPATLQAAAALTAALSGERIVGVMDHADPKGVIRHKNYELLPVMTSPNEIVGISITSFDVSELVDARLKLEDYEDRLNFALQMSNTIVWKFDVETFEVSFNGPIAQLLGLDLEQGAIPMDARKIIHPDDFEHVRAAVAANMGQDEPFSVEHRLARADGQEVWVNATSALQTDSQGRIRSLVGMSRDITELKRTQSALQHAAHAAQAANLAKSEFLANMSHELRTPLNGVMGVTSALVRTRLAPAQREMVELIESSAQTLERLLGDVLDLARVESDRFTLQTEPFDMAHFVHGVGMLFQWRARDKGVDFASHVEDDARCVFEGDVVRLRQILSNLLSNALKFTEHGAVRLSVRRGGDEASPNDVVFEVKDTGIGFSDAFAERLFERFEQADGSITRKYGGTGLGLAISRGLAQRMGGALTARSVPGQGATFTLRVPLAAAAPLCLPDTRVIDAAAEVDEAEPPAEAPLRVLLAEDHPINRQVVEMILASANIQVVAVENGAQALEAAAREAFDLVLMDMQMPVMDGLTAIRAIRSRETAMGAVRTPVVTLTANAMPEHIAASREAGADAHLSKPITAQGLLSAVDRMTRSRPVELALAC